MKKVSCKLCDQQLADGGGTTNLQSHLPVKHPEEYKRCANHDDFNSKQILLENMLQKCSPQRAAAIAGKITKFIAKDLCPLIVVDGDGFEIAFHML